MRDQTGGIGGWSRRSLAPGRPALFRIGPFALLAALAALVSATRASAELGRDWQQVTKTAPWSPPLGHASAVFGGKVWILGGGTDEAWCSPDGQNWTRAVSGAPWGHPTGHASVVFNGRLWMIGGGFDRIASRNDIWSSPDGVRWTSATPPPVWPQRSGHSVVVLGGKMWLLGGNFTTATATNFLWSSTDGVHWTTASLPAPWPARSSQAAVVFNNKLWVMGGIHSGYTSGTPEPVTLSDVWSSPDGVNWTSATAAAPWPARYGHTALAFGGKIWILGGQNGPDGWRVFNDVWSSPDGVHWTSVTLAAPWPARYGHTSVVFGGKLWVVGGHGGAMCDYKNDVWSSPDGAHWTLATPPAGWGNRTGHASLVYNNRMWVIGGGTDHGGETLLNDVWWSGDGARWTSATAAARWTARYRHAAVVHNNKMWVLGGYGHPDVPTSPTRPTLKNEVWHSTDGARWTSATLGAAWSRRDGHAAVSFNGRIWVFGGYNGRIQPLNDVWHSADGVRWTSATLAAPWAGRWGLAAVVHDGKMWIMGGIVASEYETFNDVWWSTDGVRWTAATLSAAWSPRLNPAVFVHDGRMWLLGGEGLSPAMKHDVWYSWDGKRWFPATGAAPWRARVGHTALGFRQALWVLGGTPFHFPVGDVWRSPQPAASGDWWRY